MKELQIFNNDEFGQIRTIALDGEPWMVGKDVALALGYSNTKGLQYRVNDQWLLYQQHRGKGYTDSETFTIHHRDGTTITRMFTRWTQKGRLLIHEILTRRGIQADMDKEGA